MFYFDSFYGKKVLKSTLLEEYDCFFTTREFPLAYGSIEEMEETCTLNKKFLMEKLNCGNLIVTKQVHGNHIEIADKEHFFYDNTDAIITSIKNSVAIMNFADCVPIILYSKKDNIGSIIHAGWRGTALNIVSKTICKLNKELNVLPKDITALIGPAIGKCCFETDEDVFDQLIQNVNEKNLYEKKGNKYHIDLKLLNKKQLLENDVQNIDISDYCTCCMSDIFFSYRKEKGITARHSAVLKIKGDK